MAKTLVTKWHDPRKSKSWLFQRSWDKGIDMYEQLGTFWITVPRQ